MISQNLNPRQKEAATHGKGPLLIAAGAGSGKTKTLTSRLAYFLEQGVPGEHIIAITFTNKAAKEMADRVGQLLSVKSDMEKGRGRTTPPSTSDHSPFNINHSPFIGTFHSLGARILKKEGGQFGRSAGFSIFDNDDSGKLIKNILKRNDAKKEKWGPSLIEHHISKIKNDLLDPEKLDIANPELKNLVWHTYQAYESELASNNGYDFDDLIEKPVKLFLERQDILEKYRNKFQYILVDEFQDINEAQYQFIRLLAKQHNHISVVGDDNQSIYSFRGSDFRNFLNFEKDWPGAKVVLLEENYRSTQNIIKAASAVIARNKLQKPKNLWTQNPAGDPIRVWEHENEDKEAAAVAETIASSKSQIASSLNQPFAINHSPIATIGILYRTNAQSRPMEQALIELDIPYQIFGGIRFYERKEIKDILAALRYAANPHDEISRERLSQNFLKRIYLEFIDNLPRLAMEISPAELIGYILKTSNYFGYLKRAYPNHEERAENIAELINFALENRNLSEFLERVSLFQSGDAVKTSKKPAAVNLMTIHTAKGLEFDAVFVLGVSEGILPHQNSYGDNSEGGGVEEERRLMYVAMTRARNKLCLNFYDIGSRFLYEIPPELIDFKSFADFSRSDLDDDEERYITFD